MCVLHKSCLILHITYNAVSCMEQEVMKVGSKIIGAIVSGMPHHMQLN